MKTKSLTYYFQNLAVAIALALALSFNSCKQQQVFKAEPFKVEHVKWSLNTTLYEVNIRQYTSEGTFSAFEEHLPRLKELGVGILWLMPIHPIGELERKGTLGSYYSIQDYKGINPEFGNMEDFKRLVKKAHELDMKIILDWVANHTSHDNPLVHNHPEWFERDSLGNLISPFDWTDVVQLDYKNDDLRDYMVSALKFWVEEADIDGYRCDVANLVPTDFWNRVREELENIKPVFMLAEAEEVELQKFAFDADYGWEFHHIMNDIAKGKKTAMDIDHYFQRELAKYPKNTIRMHFTSNHDENSWAGTEFTRLGKGVKTFAALTFVIPGIPLLYNGQEVAFDKMLEFFDKDLIDWTPNPEFTEFYSKLINLKKENSALMAGEGGADMFRVKTSNDVNVFAFTRENDKNKIFAVFNLSSLHQNIDLHGDAYIGEYKELFSNETVTFNANSKLTLNPWSFNIYFY
jgi:glycosidase